MIATVAFEVKPIVGSSLSDVAAFVSQCYNAEAEKSDGRKLDRESAFSVERRLRWLLIDNPAASGRHTPFGYCLRDEEGAIRGLDLCFPVSYYAADKQLLGLGSGTFLVDPAARSMGFFLFKKCLNIPGYDFYFASSCNATSSELWKNMGAYPVPKSEIEYILPVKLDAMLAAYVSHKTSNQKVAQLARACGWTANPVLRLLRRQSRNFTITPCRDWEKLSELSRRHRSPDYITSDRSPAFLQWRYGPGSPSHACDIYLVADSLGNEGWFSLGHLVRGDGEQFRASVLLDAIWPQAHISYRDMLSQILRVTESTADAVCFRWRPGLDAAAFGHYIIPRKLEAPRSYVRTPRGIPPLQLDLLDYDDSEHIAWTFRWRDQ